LLGDQAEIGVVDSQGWQEIHQVFEHAMFPRNKRTGSIKTRGLSPQ
jgi:hypothetical protein